MNVVGEAYNSLHSNGDTLSSHEIDLSRSGIREIIYLCG